MPSRCATCNAKLADSPVPWSRCPFCGGDPATSSAPPTPEPAEPPAERRAHRRHHRVWGLLEIAGGASLIAIGWLLLHGAGSLPRFPVRLAAFCYLPIAGGFFLAAHGLLRAVTGSYVSFLGSESPDERDS